MTRAGTLLRAARASSGLTQAEVVRRSGVDKSTVSLIESGRRNPSLEKVDHLLRSTGRRVGIYPTTRSGSVEAGGIIGEWVADGDEEAALRAFLRFSDNLSATTGVDRVVLAAAEPPPTGSATWDAALAAVTEYWLEQENLPKPAWVDDESRTLREATPLILNRWTSARSIRDVPNAFGKHRVLVDESTLQSA
ncbi:helix-turn-helix transcriptional regulator [Agromyces sp. H66]|uniref:helix-turn-helix domain-containing protein n=1 Tax=Agromyces sp. H66 TaxID=2529859 RepID=UPI0020BD49E0|nr:helix-turn-helix transcriptional regulator [Agromyces sp. H66]